MVSPRIYRRIKEDREKAAIATFSRSFLLLTQTSHLRSTISRRCTMTSNSIKTNIQSINTPINTGNFIVLSWGLIILVRNDTKDMPLSAKISQHQR